MHNFLGQPSCVYITLPKICMYLPVLLSDDTLFVVPVSSSSHFVFFPCLMAVEGDFVGEALEADLLLRVASDLSSLATPSPPLPLVVGILFFPTTKYFIINKKWFSYYERKVIVLQVTNQNQFSYFIVTGFHYMNIQAESYANQTTQIIHVAFLRTPHLSMTLTFDPWPYNWLKNQRSLSTLYMQHLLPLQKTLNGSISFAFTRLIQYLSMMTLTSDPWQ